VSEERNPPLDTFSGARDAAVPTVTQSEPGFGSVLGDPQCQPCFAAVWPEVCRITTRRTAAERLHVTQVISSPQVLNKRFRISKDLELITVI